MLYFLACLLFTPASTLVRFGCYVWNDDFLNLARSIKRLTHVLDGFSLFFGKFDFFFNFCRVETFADLC